MGDAKVGKTALVQRFSSGGQAYPKNYVMTVETLRVFTERVK